MYIEHIKLWKFISILLKLNNKCEAGGLLGDIKLEEHTMAEEGLHNWFSSLFCPNTLETGASHENSIKYVDIKMNLYTS